MATVLLPLKGGVCSPPLGLLLAILTWNQQNVQKWCYVRLREKEVCSFWVGHCYACSWPLPLGTLRTLPPEWEKPQATCRGHMGMLRLAVLAEFSTCCQHPLPAMGVRYFGHQSNGTFRRLEHVVKFWLQCKGGPSCNPLMSSSWILASQKSWMNMVRWLLWATEFGDNLSCCVKNQVGKNGLEWYDTTGMFNVCKLKHIFSVCVRERERESEI